MKAKAKDKAKDKDCPTCPPPEPEPTDPRANWSRFRWRINRWKIIIVHSFTAVFGGLFLLIQPILTWLQSSAIDWTVFYSPKTAVLITIAISILTIILKLFFSDCSPLEKPEDEVL